MAGTPWEGSMTTTKAVYLFAAIVPFGCVILAAIALAHMRSISAAPSTTGGTGPSRRNADAFRL